MSKQPWYHAGLRFRCAACGDCCTGDPGFVWVDDARIRALAAALDVDTAKFLDKYTRQAHGERSLIEFPNGDCVFFDGSTRRCTVYDERPDQCRTWPFWESNVVTPEAWAEAAHACPGIGQGPLMSQMEIEALVRVILV